MAVAIFWFCVFLLVYVYFGYPLTCALLARVLRRWPRTDGWVTDAELPQITVLIAAYNEADCIFDTVRNKLALDYPEDRLEVVVVSDGSDDGTDEIVTSLADPRVRLIRQEPRAGKTSALNLAVRQINSDVIVFSDANSLYAPDALRHLVAPLVDHEVGYVTGRMLYRAPDGSLTGEGCSAYMTYENKLRWWETGMGSIVGVDGGIDAVRRDLYQPMRPDQLPDFVLPLSVRERGFRAVYAPQAKLYEDALARAEDEFRMRVRVSLRAWHALLDKACLLNPLHYGLFAWQLLSHKILRYLSFAFQVGTMAANVVLAGTSSFWQATLILQVFFYALAILGYLRRHHTHQRTFLTFPYYLCLLNLASLVAFLRFLGGKKQVTWEPRT